METDNNQVGKSPENPNASAPAKKNAKAMGAAAGMAAVLVAVAVLFAAHVLCIHDWREATCAEPERCDVCDRTRGDALGHEWQPATCTAPATCSRCDGTQGEPDGHSIGEWTVEAEATCSETGKKTGECAVCGETVREDVPKVDHAEGEWTVTKEAAMGPDGPEPGERTLPCAACGAEMRTESFTLTPEEIEAAFKESCAAYAYDEVFRNPDEYTGKNAAFTGEVVQVMEEDGTYVLRVNVTKGEYGIWEDTMMVAYEAKEGEPRILEGDIVTMHGTLAGLYTYESVFGAKITVPAMAVEYIGY